MNVEIQLTDDTGIKTLPRLNANILTPSDIDGAQDVVTMDNNISTYFTARKKQWSHTWARLNKEEYDLIRGFYDRQFNLNILKFPRLTIAALGVNDVPVRVYLDAPVVINNCLDYRNITLTLRQTSNGE